MKIAVCVPARDQVHMAFAFDLTRAVAFHSKNTDDQVLLFHSLGTLICNQRQELATEALKAEADWILFLDTDMRFPKDVISRMLAREKPVVAANYSTRRAPVLPVTFKRPRLDDRVYTYPDSTGLEECYATGMGVFLISAEAFKAMPLPWFQIGWAEGIGDFVGEDIYLCRQLRAHGYTVLIDHDLSKEVRHIGTWEYSTEHACVVQAQAAE